MSDPAEQLESLRRSEASGVLPEWLFFWKAHPGPGGRPGPGCLSQWWRQAFTVDGVEYLTAEHWMMAEKARLFGDEAAVAQILATDNPVTVKKLGQTVANFDDAAWLAHRYDIVVAGNRAKFSAHADLADYLASTGDRVIVEASPLDRIWGIGLAANDERATRPSSWRGLNLLGFALMDVRAARAAFH
jgi:ribA/ribD-fused uncharacterized protein